MPAAAKRRPVQDDPAARADEPQVRFEPPRGRLLRALGVFGLDALEPVVVAALATESPLLLVGPHGTAKSRLLLRLAEALGLSSRHYNASLLSFDDLVGYPLPDEKGELRFVRTPASVWDAQVVFLDEISRCRPDVQNRVFSIVHERRVQGIELPMLRHRWAAMNPPALDDGSGADDYVGAEPLDVALADRFPFVVAMPSWEELTDHDRSAIILADDAPVSGDAAEQLRAAVAAARERAEALRGPMQEHAATYVRLILPLLQQAGAALSPRRANMLLRNVLSVHAASLGLDPATRPGSSAWLALQWSLPQRACGVPCPRADKLLLAHRAAWEASRLDEVHPQRLLLAERDPAFRAILALSLPGLPDAEVSAHVADALAGAPPGARHALAISLMESPGIERLHVAVAAQVAELHGEAVVGSAVFETARHSDARHVAWKAVESAVARAPDEHERKLAGNVLASLFVKGALATPEHVDEAFAAFTTAREHLRARGRR